MKGTLDLKVLPRSLSRFKLNLFVFFGVLILTAIIMLTVNLTSKSSFLSNV
jgi:hypothetical protein